MCPDYKPTAILNIGIIDKTKASPLILADIVQNTNRRIWNPHLTALANSFGLLQKDIAFLEYLSGAEWFGVDSDSVYLESAEKMNKAFSAALAGDIERLPAFYLYRYTKAEGFVLLRNPTT